jgi:hypothetical protein
VPSDAQESAVHSLLSPQSFAPGPAHTPLVQVSPVVHGFPSSHEPPLAGANAQPLGGLQVSVVQGSLSLQTACAPVQVPPVHTSFAVHALPSLQGSVLFVNTQPVAVLQVSSVHGFRSLHTVGLVPEQVPPWHVSLAVQALPSLHVPPFSGAWTHPVARTQESVVQALPSLQDRATPATQVPSAHRSVPLHGL